MDSLPPGFVRRATDGGDAVLRADVAEALVAAGVGEPEAWRARKKAAYEGRGRPFGVDVPGAGRVFVRQYLHGGALRKMTGDVFRGEGRFLSELAALVAAEKAEVPVEEALGVVSRKAPLGMRRGWLLAREIVGADDVLTALGKKPAPRKRRAFLEASGRAMRALHDAGFEHPDLHFKNLLAAPDGRVLVLDFDAVRRRPKLSQDDRLAGLFRFDRYAAKHRRVVSRADRMRTLKSYAGRDWPREDELRALARKLARHIARHEAVR